MKNEKNKASENDVLISKMELTEAVSAENENISSALVKQEQSSGLIQTFDMSNGIPDMDQLDVAPLDLMANYWTPENPGEKKKLLFDRIADREIIDQKTGEVIQLPCAFFYEQVGVGADKKIQQISNGSKRLVGAIEANHIKQGSALEITYLGKKKNLKNEFKSDNWSIKPLILKLS